LLREFLGLERRRGETRDRVDHQPCSHLIPLEWANSQINDYGGRHCDSHVVYAMTSSALR
jgi:hypothetical protein